MTLPFREVVYYLGPTGCDRAQSLESRTRSLRWSSPGTLSLAKVIEEGVYYVFEMRAKGEWTGPMEVRGRRATINWWLGMLNVAGNGETNPDLPLSFRCAGCDLELNRLTLRGGNYRLFDPAIPISCPCGQRL